VPILLFLGLNISIFVISGLPDRSEVGRRWMKLISLYQSFFSLDQNWSMFAPNPSQVNSYVDAALGNNRSLAKLEYFRYYNQIPDPSKQFIRHGDLSWRIHEFSS
jgi:hypothetical protein